MLRLCNKSKLNFLLHKVLQIQLVRGYLCLFLKWIFVSIGGDAGGARN
jgi:hypothetical protein